MNEQTNTAPDFPTPDDRKPDRLVIDGLTTSPTMGAIAGALAKAQAAVGKLAKASTAQIPGKNGKSGYSYAYATLADTIEAIRDCFAENEIAVIQSPALDRNFVVVTTTLVHSSGEWISSSLAMRAGGDRAQETGSAITYARRYALQSMAGIAPDDDDGAAAQSAATNQPREEKQPPRPAAKPKSEIEKCRVRFGELLRERRDEITKAGGEWKPGAWQTLAAAASGLEKWPEQPSLENYRKSIAGLENLTLDDLGVKLPGSEPSEGDAPANSPADIGGATSRGGWSGAGEPPKTGEPAPCSECGGTWSHADRCSKIGEPDPTPPPAYDPGDGNGDTIPILTACPECGHEGGHADGCAIAAGEA